MANIRMLTPPAVRAKWQRWTVRRSNRSGPWGKTGATQRSLLLIYIKGKTVLETTLASYPTKRQSRRRWPGFGGEGPEAIIDFLRLQKFLSLPPKMKSSRRPVPDCGNVMKKLLISAAATAILSGAAYA